MKKLWFLGILLFSNATFADDLKQKEKLAQQLVSIDGTEQGLLSTDK